MDVMITGPSLSGLGGVGQFFRATLPFLNAREEIRARYVTIGGEAGEGRPFHLIGDQWRVNRELLDTPDLLHVNPSLNLKSLVRDGLFLRQAVVRKVPVVAFVHGWSETAAMAISDRWHRLFRNVYGQVDAFVVLASEFERQMRQWGIRQPIHCHTTVVEHHLAEDLNIESRAKTIAEADPVKVLFLSRIEAVKGVFETLDAVAALAKAGRKVELTIAGDGSAAGEVAARVRHGNIKVALPGYVRGYAKRDLFRSHHIFCLPTYHGEGLPIAVLEAMACGMPVVTSPTGGLVDLIQEGRMGYFVRPKDSEHLGTQLSRLLQDRAGLEAMSRYNYEYACSNFMAGTVAARLVAVYQEVLMNSGIAGRNACVE